MTTRLLTAILCFFLASCGGGGGGSDSPTPTPTPPPPPPPADTTPPAIQIVSPTDLGRVGQSPVTVSGTVNESVRLLEVKGIAATINGQQWSADVDLSEGRNTIVVVAEDTAGNSSSASIEVTLDTAAPVVTVENPVDSTTVFTSPISVSGIVNDIVSGTVTAAEAAVDVNGIQAQVANRHYLAGGIVLQPGLNDIVVTGTDEVGNARIATVSVNYEPPVGRMIAKVSGDGQSETVLTELADPLVVQVVDELGAPVVGAEVVFRVVQGDGVLNGVGPAVVAISDAGGLAAVQYRLGSRAGTGNHRARARATRYAGEALFNASATAAQGDKVSVISGNNQRGGVNEPLARPLVVAVTDVAGNLVPDAEVTFSVTAGDGTFADGTTTVIAQTDRHGRAVARFTAGSQDGLDVHRVSASLSGATAFAGFTASAFVEADPANTTVSGVVLDNQDNPVPGVTVSIEDTSIQAIVDANGQFTLNSVPVGQVHLIADGTTASVPGDWPTLAYELHTVAGVDNPLSMPIYMVKLDTQNSMMVGAEDVVYTLREVPGFALTVRAGSVAFPDGSTTGEISVTPVNSNKVPMPPPNGMQPQFIVTIQPAGAVFAPPAALTLPNVDGHAPGAEVEMYSFDHDLEEFVTIGLGTVSADGSIIESNPGVGVVKAGWHCGSQPGGSGCLHGCPECLTCVAPECVCNISVPDCATCEGQACDGCVASDCETCTGLGCSGCDGQMCQTCEGAGCGGCGGPDCETCSGTDCPGCGGPDCQTCSGSDCPSRCEGADCDLDGDGIPDLFDACPLVDESKLSECEFCVDDVVDRTELFDITVDVEAPEGGFRITDCPGIPPPTLTLSVSANGRNCTPAYTYDFGQGIPFRGGSATSFEYSGEGTFSPTVQVTCEECPQSLTAELEDIIVTKRTSQDILSTYQILMTGAWSLGGAWTQAGDNLEHFLIGQGAAIQISRWWLMGFQTPQAARDAILASFTADINEIIDNLAPGESFVYPGNLYPPQYVEQIDLGGTRPLSDEPLYFASGSSRLSSEGSFTISRSPISEVTISGDAAFTWYDRYDWHVGLAVEIGGVRLEDTDGICLQDLNIAFPYDMNSNWEMTPIYDSGTGIIIWQ